jgi:ribosomal protein S18 acetylase RimI-like enzyme
VDKVEILALPPDEWRAYRKIRLLALELEARAFGTSLASASEHGETVWRSRLESCGKDRGNRLLFAREGREIVGMVGSFPREGSELVEIISLFVVPSARGKGVAKALMSALLDDLAADPSIQSLSLFVNKSQESAVRLYEGFGFRFVSEDEGEMGDGNRYVVCRMDRVEKL